MQSATTWESAVDAALADYRAATNPQLQPFQYIAWYEAGVISKDDLRAYARSLPEDTRDEMFDTHAQFSGDIAQEGVVVKARTAQDADYYRRMPIEQIEAYRNLEEIYEGRVISHTKCMFQGRATSLLHAHAPPRSLSELYADLSYLLQKEDIPHTLAAYRAKVKELYTAGLPHVDMVVQVPLSAESDDTSPIRCICTQRPDLSPLYEGFPSSAACYFDLLVGERIQMVPQQKWIDIKEGAQVETDAHPDRATELVLENQRLRATIQKERSRFPTWDVRTHLLRHPDAPGVFTHAIMAPDTDQGGYTIKLYFNRNNPQFKAVYGNDTLDAERTEPITDEERLEHPVVGPLQAQVKFDREKMTMTLTDEYGHPMPASIEPPALLAQHMFLKLLARNLLLTEAERDSLAKQHNPKPTDNPDPAERVIRKDVERLAAGEPYIMSLSTVVRRGNNELRRPSAEANAYYQNSEACAQLRALVGYDSLDDFNRNRGAGTIQGGVEVPYVTVVHPGLREAGEIQEPASSELVRIG